MKSLESHFVKQTIFCSASLPPTKLELFPSTGHSASETSSSPNTSFNHRLCTKHTRAPSTDFASNTSTNPQTSCTPNTCSASNSRFQLQTRALIQIRSLLEIKCPLSCRCCSDCFFSQLLSFSSKSRDFKKLSYSFFCHNYCQIAYFCHLLVLVV